MPIARGRMKLNHLFFAEDNFLFCKANVSEWCHLPQVIDTYEQASGQKLNKKKASIFVSRSTSAANRRRVTKISRVQSTQCFDKYLG